MYSDDDGIPLPILRLMSDDELEEIIPKKVRKPSKPKGTLSYMPG